MLCVVAVYKYYNVDIPIKKSLQTCQILLQRMRIQLHLIASWSKHFDVYRFVVLQNSVYSVKKVY